MRWETVVAICVPAIITVWGWVVAHRLARSRDDRARQIERQLKYYERQIEEFYSPLFIIAQQIVNIFKYYEKIPPDPEHREKAAKYMNEHFFFPLHEEALRVLTTRMHLVSELPAALWHYLNHVTQQRIQYELAEHAGVSLQIGEPWPHELWGVLERGIGRARAQKQALQKQALLQARTWRIRTREAHQTVALLAPVPLGKLESGLASCAAQGKVAFDSRGREVFRKLDALRNGLPVDVYIFALWAETQHVWAASWRAVYIGQVESGGGAHPDGRLGWLLPNRRLDWPAWRFLPPSTGQKESDNFGPGAVFWEVRDLRYLEESEFIPIKQFTGLGTQQHYPDHWTPEGPLLVEHP